MATHSDSDVIGDDQWFFRAPVINYRPGADKDMPADFDMAAETSAWADLRKVAQFTIVANDAVRVDDSRFTELGIRANVGEGADEATSGNGGSR